ncbi:MAG: hypothetical protein M1818_005839 [Claussenomyces sp. TS43310]|nr:MAG: hypothetical protein M1818_005839 [Claussenomyces sp. TS43310]
MSVKTVNLKPFSDQKPGTSGLRKKVTVFQQDHYSESFVTSILLSIPEGAEGSFLVIGGDGRYWNPEVVQLIAKIGAAYGVKKLLIGQDGILSTPAASHIIRKRKATGGILLTASHNAGGPKADFGIKYNLANGGPAPESVTNKIFAASKALTSYKIADLPHVDISTIGTKTYGSLEVEVIDSVADYMEMLKDIFDFKLIKKFFQEHSDFKVLFDALSGVTGPYGKAIFEQELGLKNSTQNCIPSPDFNGGHPDPNLTYAHSLVEAVDKGGIHFGAASDGDGDRNMIYGANAFVSPGDSLAIIAHHATLIPYFQKQGVFGLARSMPTSGAVDLVAKKQGLNCYEVPTGWKFFCALFDADKLSICGEESFGTGSNHVREKDGMWAIVAWLNIIAGVGEAHPDVTPSIAKIQHDFWNIYGRTFFTRYDYENVDSEGASKVIKNLDSLIADKSFIGSQLEDRTVSDAGDFSYTDLDGSVSSNQGLYVKFDDGSRVVVRLSGTGSSGATIRLYVEKHTSDAKTYGMDAQDFLKPDIKLATDLLKFKEFVGRTEPDILLVPTTEVLLTSRDRESGSVFAELASSDDFLASHVLRIPSLTGGSAGGKDVPNMRENRGKPKQFTTLNGRTVVIKDNFVYSNKGFKTLNQAQILNDVLWYPDSSEPRGWLVYYISRPLIGIYEEMKTVPAVLPFPRTGGASANASTIESPRSMTTSGDSLPQKKDIKTFHDLLNSFPLIARQMQPGLERLFKEFSASFERPLPPPHSASAIPDHAPEGPITTAVRRARSSSMSSTPTFENTGNVEGAVPEQLFVQDDEEVMRGALETAVTAAIDLFQMVDKQQLSVLGATTDLTGPVVERLIERYVAEQVHDTVLFPKLCALKRPEDLDLESKIRQMEFVDVSQVGIYIQDGQRGKHELTLRLGRAVEEFRKLSVAESPQQMMDILLSTLKTVTKITNSPSDSSRSTRSTQDAGSEKISPVLTINADTLVSLLLIVVIRAQIRYLQARLLYMRHFIFIDDVESGEMGYALSTFEAVLSYLARDSGGLRKASRRNKKLWQATTKGELHEMMKIMEPEKACSPEDSDEHDEEDHDINLWERTNGHSRSSSGASIARRLSQTSTLNHVFPFQIQQSQPESHEQTLPLRKPKMVTLDMRSMSSNSESSFQSRATTIDSTGSGLEGDTSIERLSQTEDAAGESVLMMAIQHERPESLRYMLSLEEYYPMKAVLGDTNNESSTLLSAAVQLGHTELIDIILDFVFRAEESTVVSYLAIQDTRGRSVAHYLFNAPSLISRVGRLLPWRQKDRNGQTPLFALCRSYDHGNYKAMVEAGLTAATAAQGDGQPLHLDDHIDLKGNTLLHITNDPQVALRIMFHCDADVNATNDKKHTALMVASKYGRLDMVRALFSDPRVDLNARELRGLTAVELAKDDEVRNRIDDLILFSGKPAEDGRITAVVRSFFVEDATIRLVIKSGAPSMNHSFTVTTCRRSLSDFERLARLLAIENPASWLPTISGMRSPFQITAKPSRAVLRDIQVRLDGFLKILLSHTTFATHEMLWEFFLVPDIQAEMMERRSQLKAETRVEKIREEYEPIEDIRDVEQFVDYAREMVRNVNHATKSVIRRTNALCTSATDLYDAGMLAVRVISAAAFLPQTHISAAEAYFRTLSNPSNPPYAALHSTLSSIHSTLIALLLSLSRPTSLISSIEQTTKTLSRNYNSLSRSTRWPLGLLDDTRQRIDKEREEKVKKVEEEREDLSRELRYTQQVVAGELAGWQEWRAKVARNAVRDLAKSMVVQERARLEGMRRALRHLRTQSDVVMPANARDTAPPLPSAIGDEGNGESSSSVD